MSVTDNPNGAEQAQPGRLLPPAVPAKPLSGSTQVSSEEPKFTQADMDKATKHAAESQAGRLLAQERKAMRDERDAMELKGLEGQESNVIDAAKTRQEAKRLDTESKDRLAEAEAKATAADETLASAKDILVTAKADQLATKHNIDVNQLLSYTGDITKMDAIASLMPKVDPDASAVEINPDSGESAGGGRSDDATFLKGFGDGSIPMTQANLDRYNKIKASRQ